MFRDDGARLSVGSTSSTGALWDAEHGRKITDYRQPSEDAGGDFSSTGARYATSSENNFGALWDTDTGRFLAPVLGKGGSNDVVISSDGHRLAVQTIAYAVVVFDVTDPPASLHGAALRARACAVNRGAIGVFPREVLEKTSDLSRYLRGRPSNPCDWRGLLSLDGWKQELHYWAVRLGVRRD
jgi:hypothetical protein